MMWMLMAQWADDNVGDNDGLFFSLAWRRRTGTCRKERGLSRVVTGTHNARRGDRQRQVRQAALSPWGFPRECPLACLLAVQEMGVSPQQRLRRFGFGFLLLRHKDRLSEVQGVQEVAGTQLAPVVKKLRQVDVVATPDVPLPALARGRAAALTLEKGGLGRQRSARGSVGLPDLDDRGGLL